MLAGEIMPHVLQEPLILMVLRCAATAAIRLLVVIATVLRLSLNMSQVHHPLCVLIAHLIRKHLDDGALVRRQVFRHLDLELDAEVAVVPTAAAQSLHAHAGKRDLITRTRACANLDLDFTVESGDPDLTTQDGGSKRDGRRVQYVGAGAGELGIWRDTDEHVEITLL